MRVDDRVRKTIVFVGTSNPRGFLAYGTAFLGMTFIEDHGFQTLITARHVIEKIPGDRVHIRLNTLAGGAEILDGPKSDWMFHPDKRVDVALCPVGIPHEKFDITHIPLDGREGTLTDDVIASGRVGVGNEVFVAGVFVARQGDSKNIPIIRVGNVAAMAEEKIKTTYGFHHAYLIESRSIDGLSGSPVYVRLDPVSNRTGQLRFEQGYLEYFMGMLLGTNETRIPVDSLEVAGPNDDDPVEQNRPSTQYLNTGIGIVLPVSYLIDAVNQPELLKKREATLREPKDPDRRYRANAAGPISVAPAALESAKEEGVVDETSTNPSHREDFTRLVDAAARKKPQGE